MNNTIRLIKYHIMLLSAFSFFVLSAFYTSEGGDFNTPLPLALYYLISAILLYIPLIFTLTLFNFFILAIGLSTFKGFRNQVIICFLPVLLFSAWFVFSKNNSAASYLILTDLQFYTLTGIWCFLILTGITIYAGMRQYALAAFLPAMIFAPGFFLQKYNFTPGQLSLTNFNFNTILLIWTALNYYLLYFYRKKILSLQNQVPVPVREEI